MGKNSTARANRSFQTPHGNNLPRVGNVEQRKRYTTDDVAKAQGVVLTAAFGAVKSELGFDMKVASPAKEQARVTGQSERACRNQQAGLNCMSLTEFFNACQVVPSLREWGAEMIGLKLTNDPALEERWDDGSRNIKFSFDFNGVELTPKKPAAKS